MSLRIKLQLRDEGADLRISLPPPEARIRSASTFLGPPPDHEGHDVMRHAARCPILGRRRLPREGGAEHCSVVTHTMTTWEEWGARP